MSQKRTDLAKSLNRKIQGQMQHAAIPGRFAQAAAVPDRREQRKLDQAAGLVPFAVKLNKDLVARLTEQAAAQQVSLSTLVDQLLCVGLAQQPGAAAVAPVAKKAAGKPVAEKAVAEPAPKAPAKKTAAKPVAAKPAVKPAAKAPKPTEKKSIAEKASAQKVPAKKAPAKKAEAKKPASKTAKKAAR